MQINYTLTKQDLLKLIREKFEHTNPNLRTLKDSEIRLRVKSEQNYRSEWEDADFKAEVTYNDNGK